MAQLRLNGVPTGGQVYELNLSAGKTLLDAKRQGEKDGLDQLYFEVGNRQYVVEGDGLELSGLKQGVFQSVELVSRPGQADQKSELGTLRVLDDEVNTAWEGVKHVSKASLALLTGGLIGGGVVAGKAVVGMAPAVGHVGQGMQAMEGGMMAVKAGMKPMMQGVDLSIGAAQQLLGTAAAPQSKGILDKLWGGVEKVTSLPQRTAEINTGLGLMREGAQTASQGLVKTEEGLAHFTASAELARQGGQTLKQAAKVVGIGVAIAGTVAIGGAIYGAARGSEENALGTLKGKALP